MMFKMSITAMLAGLKLSCSPVYADCPNRLQITVQYQVLGLVV